MSQLFQVLNTKVSYAILAVLLSIAGYLGVMAKHSTSQEERLEKQDVVLAQRPRHVSRADADMFKQTPMKPTLLP